MRAIPVFILVLIFPQAPLSHTSTYLLCPLVASFLFNNFTAFILWTQAVPPASFVFFFTLPSLFTIPYLLIFFFIFSSARCHGAFWFGLLVLFTYSYSIVQPSTYVYMRMTGLQYWYCLFSIRSFVRAPVLVGLSGCYIPAIIVGC